MHLGKFHALLTLLAREYKKFGIAAKLEGIIAQLDSLASNPGSSDVAKSFKLQLDGLRNVLAKSKLNKPYPTLSYLAESIDAHGFAGDRLFDKIEGVIAKNGMTPQLAASELRNLLKEINTYYMHVEAVDDAFSHLGVEYEVLTDGRGEIGISIPEPDGERLLSDLANTAKAWDKALRPFVELADPGHNPIVVRTISSSDWQFYLASVPAVYLALSAAISHLNELLQKLVETKKLIKQLADKGVSEASTAVVQAEADNMLDRGTRALAEKIVDENSAIDAGRANELKVAMTVSLKFIARELANNVTVEVRYLPPVKKDSPDEEVKHDPEEDVRIEHLTETAAQIERNMDLVQLDSGVRELLNLSAPEGDEGRQ